MFYIIITTNSNTPWMEDKQTEASDITGRDSRLERISKL